MAWIRTIPADEADERLAELYRASIDPHTGRLDNVLSVHGLVPRSLEAHLGLYRSAMRPTAALGYAEREMIAVVVSAANECHY